MPELRTSVKARKRWPAVVLVALLAVIFAISLVVAPRHGAAEGEAFAGTDAKAVQILEDHGTEPWLEPLFSPGSGEVESGLFALQAAIGAGVLGYVLGNLNGRRTAGKDHASQGTPSPDGPPGT